MVFETILNLARYLRR